MVNVRLDCALGDDELHRNFSIRLSLRHLDEHIELSCRQSIGVDMRLSTLVAGEFGKSPTSFRVISG